MNEQRPSNDRADFSYVFANHASALESMHLPEWLRKASAEIQSLRGQLEAAEQHVKILREQRAADEPAACPECAHREAYWAQFDHIPKGSSEPPAGARDTGVTDANGQSLFEGDRVKASWLAELGITELDCESVGTVEYMPDKITAAWFIKFDRPYRSSVCPDGVYETDSLMLIQANDEEFNCRFEKLNESPRASVTKEATPPAAWHPIETAPRDGTSFVAWCVRQIEGSKDRRIDPVVARWRDPDGWIWAPPLRGGGQDRGTLTAWTAKPHPEFNCLHESERVNGDVLSCDDCGVMLEDFAMPSETKEDPHAKYVCVQPEYEVKIPAEPPADRRSELLDLLEDRERKHDAFRLAEQSWPYAEELTAFDRAHAEVIDWVTDHADELLPLLRAAPPHLADFKNFHRLLCERFNYVHDEMDWQRDQLSLIEWIAEQLRRAAQPPAGTPLQGLLSISMRPELTHVQLLYRFDSLEHAQLARDAFTPVVEGKASPPPAAQFQDRVHAWMGECFTADVVADKVERNHRYVEESLELVQSLGCTRDEAHMLVDYVFGRPSGEPHQETGGAMVTLAALCNANGINLVDAADAELARCWTKIDQIRAKQAGKPKHSPLPGPSETKSANPEDVLDDEYHAEHQPMPCIQPGLHPDKCVEHGTPAQQARNTSG